MKSRLVVTGIIERDGKFLFGKKPKDMGPYPNTWHLIGGGINLDTESVEEAFRREVREEANIELKDMVRMGFDEDYTIDGHGNDIHYVFLIFHAKYLSGEPKPGDDIVELEWFSKQDFNSIPLTTPSIKYFKQIKWL